MANPQVVRRYILGSIVDSEKNYVDALTRILEVGVGRSACVLSACHTQAHAGLRGTLTGARVR